VQSVGDIPADQALIDVASDSAVWSALPQFPSGYHQRNTANADPERCKGLFNYSPIASVHHCSQGSPVHVKHDAQMHHGQNKREAKNVN